MYVPSDFLTGMYVQDSCLADIPGVVESKEPRFILQVKHKN